MVLMIRMFYKFKLGIYSLDNLFSQKEMTHIHFYTLTGLRKKEKFDLTKISIKDNLMILHVDFIKQKPSNIKS